MMRQHVRQWLIICVVAALTGLGSWGGVPAAWAADESAAPPIRQIFDLRSTMRDGVELSSDVWLPAEPGEYPVILIRTPYIKTMPFANFPEMGKFFAERGYALVVQDVRGRGDSDGVFDFFFQEAADGHDSIAELAGEPWSNGRVCMMGVSYWATVQWLAAREKPENLVCIAPTSPAGRYLDELPYTGGAFMMGWALPWLNDTSGRISQGPHMATLDWERIYDHRPLLTMDEAMGRKMRLYREFLEHPTMDDYWRRIQFTPRDFKGLNLPVLAITGWFDGDQTGTLFYWDGMNKHGPKNADQYLTIGPWTHIQSFMGGETKLGELEFSEDAVIDVLKVHLDFFERYLKQSTESFDYPRVRLYVTGANEWRSYDRYPIPGTKERRLFLSSGGKANTRHGDGRLAWTKPGRDAPTDRYLYDPRNPVPFDLSREFAASDRSVVQEREDVLVYSSAPLDEAVTVIGGIAVELYAASDARDTDFTASILDVHPDGRAVVLGPKTVGVIRARYRDGLEKTRLLTPGKVEKYVIDLGHIAHSFKPGHSIRVEISSSAAPLVNPNQNTGNPVATDTEWRSANQEIFHNAKYPSALVLPVAAP